LLVIPDIALGLDFDYCAEDAMVAAGGMVSVDSTGLPFTARLWDLVRHMILPVTILVLGAQPILIRHVRAAVAEALEQGFVHAGRRMEFRDVDCCGGSRCGRQQIH